MLGNPIVFYVGAALTMFVLGLIGGYGFAGGWDSKSKTVNADLLNVLEQAMEDIDRTGYTMVPTVVRMKTAIKHAKEIR